MAPPITVEGLCAPVRVVNSDLGSFDQTHQNRVHSAIVACRQAIASVAAALYVTATSRFQPSRRASVASVTKPDGPSPVRIGLQRES